MTLQQYEQEFMLELEDIWNNSGRYQFLNWNSFVHSMWKAMKKRDEE